MAAPWRRQEVETVGVSVGHPEEKAVRGAERHPEAPPAGADAELHHPTGEKNASLPRNQEAFRHSHYSSLSGRAFGPYRHVFC